MRRPLIVAGVCISLIGLFAGLKPVRAQEKPQQCDAGYGAQTLGAYFCATVQVGELVDFENVSLYVGAIGRDFVTLQRPVPPPMPGRPALTRHDDVVIPFSSIKRLGRGMHWTIIQ
jgi:hypothetical protein